MIFRAPAGSSNFAISSTFSRLSAQKAIRFPFAEVPVLTGVGKGKRGFHVDKKDYVVGGTLGKKMNLVTSRGTDEVVTRARLKVSRCGLKGQVIKSRVGFTKIKPPEPVLYELPEEA